MQDIRLYNLQLLDLELFLAVAESGSFTRAGEQMFMTQSWVSKRISLMERELDLNLFTRNKREVILTPAGRVLENRLRRIYSEIGSAIQDAHIAQTGVSGVFRLGFLIWGTIVFQRELEAFIEENPQVAVEVYRHQFMELRARLYSGQLDLIFTISYDCAQFQNSGYQMLNIRPVPLMAYMHKKHHLAGRTELEVEDLQGEALLMVDEKASPGFCGYVRQLFLAHNVRPMVAHYAHDGEAHIASVLLNRGILLASQYLLVNAWEDIARVPIRGADLYVTAVWKTQNSNPVLKKFLDCISGSPAPPPPEG